MEFKGTNTSTLGTQFCSILDLSVPLLGRLFSSILYIKEEMTNEGHHLYLAFE